MKLTRIIGTGLLTTFLFAGHVAAQDEPPAEGQTAPPGEPQEDPTSMEELLDRIDRGTAGDTADFEQRMQDFRQRQAEQARLLREAEADLAAENARSDRLETTFEENERLIVEVSAQLAERLGSLNELFGVLNQVAGDARSSFELSLTNIEYPDRGEWLGDFAEKMEGSALPSIEEIEHLWLLLAQEASELGKVRLLENQRIVRGDQIITEDVVRVGAFNIIADGRYLMHATDTNSVTELQRQPSEARFLNSTSDLINAPPGGDMVRFGIDITRGQLLELLIRNPNTRETIEAGGTPGYIIIALGILGVLLSIERLITLSIAGRKVKSQLKRDTPSKNNALGRVLMVYEENKNVDTETMELKLGEAILKEQPALQRGILFIKIISVVAPLLGLLGTVVGMIRTFQVITLFGAGDATRMAGGISQALVTTMFGLIVAIPMVLLHTIVSGQSRRILQILQEQSAGIVAAQAEKA